MTARRTSNIAVVVGAAVLVVALAACGSSGDKADGPGAATTTVSDATPTTHKKVPAKKAARKQTSPTTKPKAAGATTTRPAPTTPNGSPSAVGALVVPAIPTGSQVTLPPNVGVAPKPKPENPGSHASPGTTVKPYDPSDGIDLSGTPGVTAAQQRAAEQLLRDTIRDLPAYANQSVAYAAGFRTIGDAITGDEHMINWSYVNDDRVFDAKHPESLVYKIRPGQAPLLVAAMYLLRPNDRFANIPPLFQSPLTQFHVHTNLCFRNTSDPLQKVVGGLTDSQGNCPAPTFAFPAVPMIHAWIVANPCGPFSALEGIAAGQTNNNEPVNCDSAHAGVL